jgi:putative transposase
VPIGALFHVRLRGERNTPCLLTDPAVVNFILEAARRYHEEGRWWLSLMIVMPDHIHMIASFPGEPGMSRTISAWKTILAKRYGIRWQSNYFDHRLRSDDEFVEKSHYIRMNPVRAHLCNFPEEWPWCVSLSADQPPIQVAAQVAAGVPGG